MTVSFRQYHDQTDTLAEVSRPGREAIMHVQEISGIYAGGEMRLSSLGLGRREPIDLVCSYPEKLDIRLNLPTPEEEIALAQKISGGISFRSANFKIMEMAIMEEISGIEAEKLRAELFQTQDLSRSLERSSRDQSPSGKKLFRNLVAVTLKFDPDKEALEDLRESVADTLFRSKGIPLSSERGCRSEMVMCKGSSMSLYIAALEAFKSDRGIVAIPQGAFEPIPQAVEQLGAKATIVPTAQTGMLLTAQALEDTIERIGEGKIKVLVLINPSGVFGNFLSKDELEKIAEVAVRHDIKIINDELYAGLGDISASSGAASEPFVSFASLNVEVDGEEHSMHDRTVTIQGTSKVCPYLNQKLGFAVCGDKDVVSDMTLYITSRSSMPSASNILAMSAVWKQLDDIQGLHEMAYGDQIARLNECIEHANNVAGREIFSLTVLPQTGFFVGLSINAKDFESADVYTSRDLAEYLSGNLGLMTRPLGGMFVGETGGKITVRLNITSLDEGTSADMSERMGALSERIARGNPPTLDDARSAIWRAVDETGWSYF